MSQPLLINSIAPQTSIVTNIAINASLVVCFSLVAALVGLILLDRVGRKPLQMFGFGLSALSMALIAAIPGLTSTVTPFAVVFGLSLFGIAVGPNYTTMLLAAESYPTAIRSTAHGTSAAADPGPGRVLVAIDLATICGSDLHTVHGRRDAPHPGILGHEQVGHVVAIGSGARPHYPSGAEVGIGDRVVWSITASCGRCRNCVWGLEQKCLHLKKYGHEALDNAWPLNGGFASHCVLLPGTTIVEVPDSVPDTVSAPASCATATVAAVLDAAELDRHRDPTRILITGAGMLGITAAAMADALGAWVAVCDPDPARQETAYSFGADLVVGDVEDVPPVDVALELSGSPVAVEACIACLDVGGRAVLAGSVPPVSTSRSTRSTSSATS